MKVKSYFEFATISNEIKIKISQFLEQYIPEGTVIMPWSIYESASIWTIIEDYSDKILGFSAQKVFEYHQYNVIQLMATFLDKQIRGKKFASLLMQGDTFLKTWLSNPAKPIYWCTRTRIPGAYAAAKHYDIYPKVNDAQANLEYFNFAEQIAKLVYGNSITLEQQTYVMKNSYPHNSYFNSLEFSLENYSYITNYFAKHIDYGANETIFIFAKLCLAQIIKYLSFLEKYVVNLK